MPRHSEPLFSFDDDLAQVETLVKAGRLTGYLEQLDPKKVAKCVERVPASVIRVLAAITAIPNIDEKIDEMPQAQRDVVRKILDVSRPHNVPEFIAALVHEGQEKGK